MSLLEYFIAIIIIALFLIAAVSFSVRLGRSTGINRQLPEERVQLEDEGRVKDAQDEDTSDDEIMLGGRSQSKRLFARLFGGDVTRGM